MATHSTSNTDSNPARKRRKIENKTTNVKNEISNWKTDKQQQIYSKNLLSALRQSRRDTSSQPSFVRLAADRALANTAKGRTRWSRAILTSRVRLKLEFNNKHKKAMVNCNSPMKKRVVNKKLPVVQKKVRVLSKLVPGCRKVSLPSLLEETSDYIAALEMQVKAMSALAELLSGAAGLGGQSDPVGSNVS